MILSTVLFLSVFILSSLLTPFASASSSPYDVLQVPHRAPIETCRAGYLRLARVHHPDKGGDAKEFKRLGQVSGMLVE